LLVDLREEPERERHGFLAGSVKSPYPDTERNVAPGGLLHELAASTGRTLVFYCAYGERSAMAVEIARAAGLERSMHLRGGLDHWKRAGLPVVKAAGS
jgi:rhodanese-related sulfurtransferase